MPEIRSDLTYWLDRDRDTDLNPFFSLLEDLMECLKQELFLSLQGFEFHFALYPAGGFYKPHIDQFDTRSNRMISMIVYLNAHWKEGDGGELRIHQESNFIDIAPIMNRAVLFRSDCVLHEVLPSVTPRRSLTGWLLKRPSGVGVFGL
jgi:SM-20-related protein